MQAGNEGAVTAAFFCDATRILFLEAFERLAAHVRHDAHVHDHIGAVADLDADLGQRRVERAHAERDHIHRAALHAALEFFAQRCAHFRRVGPVVGGACLVGAFRADESAVLDARHIGRRRAREKRVRAFFGVEAGEGAAFDHQCGEAIPFRL